MVVVEAEDGVAVEAGVEVVAGEEDEQGGELFDDYARRSHVMHHVHIRSDVAQ